MSYFEDDDSSSEEFMDKVNVYLNASPSSAVEEIKGILRPQSSTKSVKFSFDQEEEEDAKRDLGRSREELLGKIAKLTDILKDCEKQVQDEKDKRKKKEKK